MCSFQLLYIPFLCLVAAKVHPEEINTPILVNGRKLHLFTTTPKTTMDVFVECRSREMHLLTLTSPEDYVAFVEHVRALQMNQEDLIPISPYYKTEKVTKYLATGLSANGNGFDGTYDPASGSSLYCMSFSRSTNIQFMDCGKTLYEKYFCEETEFNCQKSQNNNFYLYCTDVQYCVGVDEIETFV